MVWQSNVISGLVATALVLTPVSAGAGQRGFAGVPMETLATALTAVAVRQGLDTRVVEEPCDPEDAMVCQAEDHKIRRYDLQSIGIAAVSVKGQIRIESLQFSCSRDCSYAELRQGLVVGLSTLAPD